MTALVVVTACVALLVISAFLSAVSGPSRKANLTIATVANVFACSMGASASITALLHGESSSLRIPWTLPLGAFHVGMDGLSAYFLLCLFLVAGLTSLYSAGYLSAGHGQRPITAQLAFFQVLLASMALLLLSRDGVLFIMAWEVMSISSYFLVTTDHESPEVARAGIIYLTASHLGTLCLFVMFAVLAQRTGSSDFDVWIHSQRALASVSSVLFALALVGFGTKAGFWPVHVWLPFAHPAAPSPVSALMSGIMIKMGVYGLLRMLSILGPCPHWWGQLLIGIGIVSGLLGVLLAVAENDLKRVLAYSSVENVGIIAIGIGIGILARSLGHPKIAWLGFAGALLHTLNHALFKSLLFEAAGSVVHATGQRDIQALGGLAKRMPITNLLFLVGSLSICGLPCFNGFVGEWLLYVGAFRGSAWLTAQNAATFIAILVALALIGGLALAGFVKAYGLVFLGQPRSAVVAKAREARTLMLVPMALAAALCLAIGMAPSRVLRLVEPAVSVLLTPVGDSEPVAMLGSLTHAVMAIIAVLALLGLLRHLLLRNRAVTRAATWGCGYSQPSPRMQYSSGSFVAPVLFVFRPLLAARSTGRTPTGFFESNGQFEDKFSDVAADRLLLPASVGLVRWATKLRVLQHGRVQLYLVYVLATLIGFLAWQLGASGR